MEVISIVDSINARISFKTLSNSILKGDDPYKNLEFYFAECLLSIL